MDRILELVPIYINGGIVFALLLSVLVIALWRKNREQCLLAFFSRLVLGEYLITIFAVTVSPLYGFSFPEMAGEINIVPFKVLDTMTGNPLNCVGNIAMFIPMGILLVLMNSKYWKIRYIFTGTGVSVLIETLQLFNNRATDIDDVILNTIGFGIGWMIGFVVMKNSLVLRRLVCKNRTTRGTNPIIAFYNVGVMLVLSLTIVMIAGFHDLNAYKQLPRTVYAVELESELLAEKEFSTYAKEQDRGVQEVPIDKQLNIQANNAIVANAQDNTILWEKAAHEKNAPASCAKLLTALVVMDYCKEEEIIKAGDELALVADDATTSYIYRGCELTVKQAMISMLLPSGNDAAYILACYTGRKIAGNMELEEREAVDIFVEKMNEKAEEVGAFESVFTTPDGYDDVGQYTTAFDLAMIGIAASENEIIADIVSMPFSKEIWVSGEVAQYNNSNEQLCAESEFYNPYCKGLKTGTTSTAGACLVSLYEIDGEKYVTVLLDSTREMRFSDASEIYENIIQM